MVATADSLGHAGRATGASRFWAEVWSWITTVDHKRIGILYGVTGFIFFLMGGLEALLIRLQLATPGATVISAQFYNELFTMHGTMMIFLAVMPLSAAMFNFMVPLMIGARDVAFPRLNAFSYWVFLFGGLLLVSSFAFGSAPDAGWFAYANLTSRSFSLGPGVDFWALGLAVTGVGSLAAALNFIVTIINMRAPGMSMMRMPVFVWMTLVTSFLMIFAFPIITAALFMLLFDRLAGTNFFVPQAGGDVVLWQHLFWMFGHPEVYILILPAMGIISEVLPTFSRKPLFGYSFVVYSGIAIAFLGFGVWAHHMFAVGLGPVADSAFAVSTMLIAIPTGVKIFNWLGTMWGGTLRYRTAMLFAIGFIVQFIVGGLSGVMHASPAADLQQTDTYFVVAHLHYVLVGGAIMGIFAGIYYWWPKITGRMLSERLGVAHFIAMFLGITLTFFPQHFLGLNGMPRRIYTYQAGLGWELWNFVSTVGAFVIALALLIFIVNAIYSLRRGYLATKDPWDGATLEWTTSSPPPVYNFGRVPHVESVRPYWEQKYGPDHEGVAPPAEEPQPGGVAVATREEEEEVDVTQIHMPNPSFFPVIVAGGITLMAAGLLLSLVVSAIGAIVLLVGIYGWVFEPPAPEEHH